MAVRREALVSTTRLAQISYVSVEMIEQGLQFAQ